MSLFCTAFFHDYGVTNTCLTNKCHALHQTDPLFNRSRDLIIKVLACLPIFGQVIGIISMVFGIQAMRSPDYQSRVVGVSLVLRGLLTFLGLGIVCLILDLIVTGATIIKNCI